jgi:hypothetical protein
VGQAVAERGYDIETLDAEIAADREREARLGLAFLHLGATGRLHWLIYFIYGYIAEII